MPEIYIVNRESFLAELRRAADAVSDLTIPLTLIGKDWMKSNRAIFLLKGPGQYADLSNGRGQRTIAGLGKRATGEKGGVGGYKWEKLKRWGFIYPILKASGALERSLTDPTDQNAVLQVVNKNTLFVGTSVRTKDGAPYPLFLHEGTKKMPARPFIFIADDRLGRWNNTLNEYVLKVVGAPGAPRQTKTPLGG